MKFGKEITHQRDQRFRDYYLNYKDLKRAIKAMRAPAEASAQAGATATKFGERLGNELDRINNFVSLQYEVVNTELKTRLRAAEKASEGLSVADFDKLAEEIVVLDRFVRLNYVGFRKITKKCDKHCRTAFSSMFMPRLERAGFRQQNFDALLWQLGRLYTHWRRSQGQGAEGHGGGHVETFFIAPEHLMRAKVLLSRRMQPGAASSVAVPPTSAGEKSKRRQQIPSIAQPFTCVYLDGTHGTQYSERAHRFSSVEESQKRDKAFRCRWEGKNDGDKDIIVNIDAQVEGGAMVEVPVKQRDMPSLLEGVLDTKKVIQDGAEDGAAVRCQVLDSVIELIRDEGLRPVVSTTFRRTAFADEGDASTCTVDEDVAFHDELKGPDAAKKDQWCRALRDLSSAVTEGRVAVPQAVLRIHVAGSGAASALRADMEAFFTPQAVQGFSRAVLGTFLLHQELAEPPPPWVPEIEPTRPPRTSEVKEAPKDVPAPAPAKPAASKPKDPPQEVPKESTGCMATVNRAFAKKHGDAALRVDIKTPLANERTVLRWLRSAVMMTSVSAFLSSRQDDASQINGLLLAAVAVLFIFWPVMIFRRRALEISEVKEVPADRILPQALALTLVVVLSATLVVHVLFADPGDAQNIGDTDPAA